MAVELEILRLSYHNPKPQLQKGKALLADMGIHQ